MRGARPKGAVVYDKSSRVVAVRQVKFKLLLLHGLARLASALF